jgi:hypothetical protein
MATLKRRINISADKDVESSLVSAAKRDGVPVATKAAELLRLALEIEEDLALAAVAEQRMKYKGKGIPHKLAWK